MTCNDPYVKALRAAGYNVIRLPRADVRPLQLLAKAGDTLDRIGDLTAVLLAGPNIALPTVKENTRVASVSGQRTGDLSAGIGLSILGSIIGAMGGSTIGLDVTYRQAESVTFVLEDVFEDRVDIALLDQYLANGDVSPFAAYVGKLLDADRLYVTTATLKSTKVSVETRRSQGSDLDVSLPEIRNVVGGNVKVGGKGDSTSKVTYEGSIPLVFGFQAAQLFYDKGRYERFKVLRDGASLESAPPGEPESPLLNEGPFVRFGEL